MWVDIGMSYDSHGFSTFEVGDRVKVREGVTGVGKFGTIIARDRIRIQYQVRLDSFTEYWYNPEEIVKVIEEPNNTAPVDSWLNFCKHELKIYTGLTEQFNYCHKCGKKEDEL
jgi:hypothetical protein